MNSFLSLKKLTCSSETLREFDKCKKFYIELNSSVVISRQDLESDSVKISSFLPILEDENGWMCVFDLTLVKHNVEDFLARLERDERVKTYVLITIPDN